MKRDMRKSPVVHINKRLILFSNPKTSESIVNAIAKEINPLKFLALPVYRMKHGYLLTDGNHRAKAAIKAGYTHIPCVLLTKEEFDYVKFSKRTAELLVNVPEIPIIINSMDQP